MHDFTQEMNFGQRLLCKNGNYAQTANCPSQNTTRYFYWDLRVLRVVPYLELSFQQSQVPRIIAFQKYILQINKFSNKCTALEQQQPWSRKLNNINVECTVCLVWDAACATYKKITLRVGNILTQIFVATDTTQNCYTKSTLDLGEFL